MLINILSNAVKYTPDGGEINFRAKETLFEEGLVHLRMEIKDNGIGMSEEFLQHIFEPFTQEQRTSRTTYKGTGLGMAITKKLVDQMHGSLDVESDPGQGFDLHCAAVAARGREPRQRHLTRGGSRPPT